MDDFTHREPEDGAEDECPLDTPFNRKAFLAGSAALGISAFVSELFGPIDALASVEPKKNYRIGVSYQALQFEYVGALQTACRQQARKMGVTILEKDAAGDGAKELANVEAFVSQKVDALAFEPLDLTASIPAVLAAKRAKIPVIEFNSYTKDSKDVDAFVISDHRVSGILIGQYWIKVLKQLHKPKLNVLYLRGQQGNITELVRNGGVQDTIKPYLGQMNVTTKVANFSRADAQRVTEDVLTRNRHIDLIVALSDSMLLGALQSVKSAGLGRKIKMIGMDGLPETLRDVQQGYVTATCFQNPQAQGAGAIQTAVRLLQGHKPSPKRKVVPFIMTDKHNLNKVLPISHAVYHH